MLANLPAAAQVCLAPPPLPPGGTSFGHFDVLTPILNFSPFFKFTDHTAGSFLTFKIVETALAYPELQCMHNPCIPLLCFQTFHGERMNADRYERT